MSDEKTNTPVPAVRNSAAVTVPSRRRHLGFNWLKAPSILLVIIGVMGILAAANDDVESALSFLKLPPMPSSIIITVLASVLMAISLLGKGPRYAQETDFLQDNWRSI